ncbi:bifunctional metallophosphatase/5'-nucleotidase [Wenzhouxiangella sediminis]|nr:5'-nucleotidase C-terminal domain-containing protein [Wenzhouxiangella sediminis]
MTSPARAYLRVLITLALSALVLACSHKPIAPDAGTEPREGLELQLLHFSDVDGGGTRALDHVAAFSALAASFRAEMPEHTVLISSGDNYIPGPLYQASNDPEMAPIVGSPGVGRGEIAFTNALGVDVSAVGNHDLDGGPEEFAGIIQPDDQGWPGARYPWVASNLDFGSEPFLAERVSPDGLPAAEVSGRLTGSVILKVDGRRIGVVGASTPSLDQITTTGEIDIRPGDPDDMDALAAVIQDEVDALAAQGVNVIILAAHMQQLHVERALAERLERVDVIIGGGSNTILADSKRPLHPGDVAVDDYPLVYRSPLDEPVLLVNTGGDYRYLGRLLLQFDAEGVISLEHLDEDTAGVWASLDSLAEARGAEPVSQVVSIRDAFWRILEDKESNVLGYTDQFLDGRRVMLRTRETNLGRLWAEASLWLARRQEPEAVVAVRNGGGIRAPIGEANVPPGSRDTRGVQLRPPSANRFRPANAISQLDVEAALAFNGRLVALTVTAGELLDVMEYAVSGIEPGATPGYFPQFAGLRMRYDASRPSRRPIQPGQGDINQGAESNGERVRDLAVVAPDGSTTQLLSDGEWVSDPDQPLRIITLHFLAQCVHDSGQPTDKITHCGDGYPFRQLKDPKLRHLVGLDYPGIDVDFAPPGTEQFALAAYLAEFHATPEQAIQLPPRPEGEQAWLIEISGM